MGSPELIVFVTCVISDGEETVCEHNALLASYDVVFTDGPETILERFDKFDARVVFSAEGFCWPDASLMVRCLRYSVSSL